MKLKLQIRVEFVVVFGRGFRRRMDRSRVHENGRYFNGLWWYYLKPGLPRACAEVCFTGWTWA